MRFLGFIVSFSIAISALANQIIVQQDGSEFSDRFKTLVVDDAGVITFDVHGSQTVQLSGADLKLYKLWTTNLATAPIHKVDQGAICFMAIPSRLASLRIRVPGTETFREVLSDRGCYMGSIIVPESLLNLTYADELSTRLAGITNNAIEKLIYAQEEKAMAEPDTTDPTLSVTTLDPKDQALAQKMLDLAQTPTVGEFCTRQTVTVRRESIERKDNWSVSWKNAHSSGFLAIMDEQVEGLNSLFQRNEVVEKIQGKKTLSELTITAKGCPDQLRWILVFSKKKP